MMTSDKKGYSLSGMITEQANPKTADLDLMSIGEILHCMNEEDKTCAYAVEKVLPLVEKIVETEFPIVGKTINSTK